MKFILCSDLHLRPDVPRCRKQTPDEWIETQAEQLKFIANEAWKRNVPVIISGDIFHIPTNPDWLKNMFIDIFSQIDVYGIAGQHDLRYHSWDNLEQSSFGVLWKSGVIKPITQGQHSHYGQPIVGEEGDLLFLHTLIFENKESMPPNTKAMTAQEALDKYSSVKWIFAGDQHKGFIYKNKSNKYVIVPGCMNTQHSDQDYPHYIYDINTEDKNIKKIEIPDYCEIVTDSYVQESNERNDRIKAFATLIKDKVEQGKGSGIDFKENVKLAMKGNKKLTSGAIKIINGFLEK